jgi:hypothetical protein
VVIPRKETKKMNYREFNPAASCLPPAAYPHLWATLLANPQPKALSLWQRAKALFYRASACLPLAFAVALLPIESPLETSDRLQSLVWVNPLPGKKLPLPPNLPRLASNPYSF